MFDKQIHKDDFKLRILVTNGCNKACPNCLNDFQPKGCAYIDPVKAYEVIRPYCMFMRKKGLTPKVEFSGGEPGSHPFLWDMLIYAKQYGAFTKVNTNGLSLRHSLTTNVVDCWHVGVTECDPKLLAKIKKVNGQAQYVVTINDLGKLPIIIDFYKEVPIKLFADFNEKGERLKVIKNLILYYADKYKNIKTRHTGIQENRGKLCRGCKKKCITLKAIWLLPDGSITLCPQRERMIWRRTIPNMEELYSQHKVGG